MQFRPARNTAPPPRRSLPPAKAETAPVGEGCPKPDWTATATAVFGIAMTALFASGKVPSQIANQAAIGVLLSLVLSVLIEARHGIRNLIRTDLLALTAFYYLSLYEFLFAQPYFDTMITTEATHSGLIVLYLGYAGLLLGRHVPVPREAPFARLLQTEVPIGKLLGLFWLAAFLGYFYMLACSEWNPVKMFDAMLGARFSQPWSRGQLGDWRAIFSELTLMLYLLPALAGVMLARVERYKWYHLTPVLIVLAATFFQGFAAGTRNVFGAYLVNFLAAFAFASPASKRTRVLVVGAICAAAMAVATYTMLQFREQGLRDWMRGTYRERGELQSKYVFVDYNLHTIATLTTVFPERAPFLGVEILYHAAIKPIPRAIWKNKPVTMSSTIENALGAEGVTIAATFAGEAFMSGGYATVILFGLVLGAVMGFWNTTASPKNSEMGILVHASGFFAAVITMRSLFAFTTAVLPTIAALMISALIVKSVEAGARQVAKLMRPREIAPRGRPAPPAKPAGMRRAIAPAPPTGSE